jgi:hypothetical protein
MTATEAKNLKPGQEVFWKDPDDGACSKYLTIKEIEVRDDMVRITDEDGEYLECLPSELSIAEKKSFQLVLDVTYVTHGVSERALKENLEQMVQDAVNNGTLTGETAAEVWVWSLQIKKSP